MFEVAAIVLLVLAWLALGFVPWLVLSVRRHGEAGFPLLVVCCLAAVAAGLLVAVAGARGWSGLLVSLLTALAASVALLTVLYFLRKRQAGWRPDPPRA